MEASLAHVAALKQALHTFQLATGLKVNFHKSCFVAVNTDETYANTLAHFFGCKVGKMPFTYLELPLGTTRPSSRSCALGRLCGAKAECLFSVFKLWRQTNFC
jgi:hypothetical protein